MHPVIFSFAGLNIFSYGLMVALAVFVTSILIYHHAQKNNMPGEKMLDLIFWIVVWGLIGGRVFYVLLNIQDYIREPLELFKLYKGGMVFHGSLIFALMAALIFIKNNKLPLFAALDVLALYIPVGHAIGRIGCFLNGCCYGLPAPTGWGVIFPGHLAAVYPTQLYSSFLLLMIFFILFFLEKKKKFNGQILFSYLILYGTMRFLIEFLRDNPRILGGLSVFQCISLLIFFAGLLLYIQQGKKQKEK